MIKEKCVLRYTFSELIQKLILKIVFAFIVVFLFVYFFCLFEMNPSKMQMKTFLLLLNTFPKRNQLIIEAIIRNIHTIMIKKHLGC